MAARIILHAGTGKTGSTSLQNTMASHRDLLAQKRLLYPALSSHAHHSYLLPAVLGDEAWPREFGAGTAERRERVLQSSELAWGALAEAVRTAAPEASLVVSCEHIVAMRGRSMARLRDRLAALADEIIPVVYIRSPVDHYLSKTQQSLKFGHRISQNFVFGVPENLRKLAHVFGVRPQVRVFSSQHLYNGCTVQDFLVHHAGFAPEDLTGIEVARNNASLSAEGTALIQQFNRAAFPGPVPFGNGLTRRVLGLIQTEEALNRYGKLRLHPPVLRAIADLNQEALDWLQENYGCVIAAADPVAPAALDAIATVADLCPVDAVKLQQMTEAVFPDGMEAWIAAAVVRQNKARQKKQKKAAASVGMI